MPSKVQLIGGNFQDSEGNLLVNGYLKMTLSQDASVSGVGNVCAGIELTIQLNASGSVSTTAPQFVWGNDNLLPVNTFYRVTGHTAQGQTAWGPNNQQVTGAGTFDVGQWIPNSIISWQPSIQSLALQTNEVPNGSQSLLDLHAGTGVTLVDNGLGRVTVSSLGSTFSGNGAFFFGPGITDPASIFALLSGNVGAGEAAGVVAANVVVVYLFQLFSTWTISKVTTQCGDSFGGVTSSFGIYSQSGNKLLDSGGFTCLASSGVQVRSITPVTLQPGVYLHAQSTTSTNNPHYPGVIVGSGGQTPSTMAFFVKNAIRAATAANQMSAGVLPATLGVLTPFTPVNSASDGFCTPLYE